MNPIFLIYLVGVVLSAILIGFMTRNEADTTAMSAFALVWPIILILACIVWFFQGLWHLGAWIGKTIDHV